MKTTATAAILIVAACSGEQTTPEPPEDASSIDAARPPDARPPTVVCEPESPPSTTGSAPPAPGRYCATWTRISGGLDPFPRYYDHAAVDFDSELWSVRWSTDGGKEYFTGAERAGNCLTVEQFSNGFSASDPLRLCWRADGATGVLRWCTPGFVDDHWSVTLTPC